MSDQNLRVHLQVKYSGDTRYNSSSGESGDDGQTYLATHDCASAATANYSGSTLMPLQASLNEVDVIGVDEGQFFPDLIQFCDLAANAGKVVVVAALDGTYTRRDFGQMGDLLACCDSITKLNAVCAICGEDAPFTRRDFFSEETKLIGGREKYTPVCRKHHTIPSDQEI